MKHAVLILAHDNIPVVKNAMKTLDDARFTFYLLIDKKSKYSAKEFIPKLNNSLCKVLKPICVNWGGYSSINAELRLIEAALKDKQEILHFLQGADLPLKTPEQIDCFCRKNNNIFIDVGSAPDLWVTYKVLCKHPLVEFKSYRNNRLLKMTDHVIAHLQKPFIKKSSWYDKLYSGSALWSIPNDFANYVLSCENEIKKLYKNSLAADEVFIHTICMNSMYKERVSEYKNCRLIDWKHREKNSPKTFTIDDIKDIDIGIEKEDMLFARKFNANRDNEVIEYVYNNVNIKKNREGKYEDPVYKCRASSGTDTSI